MKLTLFSDYALRVLLHAAAFPDRRTTISAAADYFQVSRAHLKKVVLTLSQEGFLKGVRGRTGGFELARAPEEINLGAVLRATEPDFALVECFHAGNQCCLTRRCGLPGIANEALRAFLSVFDRHTLADVRLRPELFLSPPPSGLQPMRGPDLTEHPVGGPAPLPLSA